MASEEENDDNFQEYRAVVMFKRVERQASAAADDVSLPLPRCVRSLLLLFSFRSRKAEIKKERHHGHRSTSNNSSAIKYQAVATTTKNRHQSSHNQQE
ncbi:hypothetical protein ACLKA7_015607 [Drosophila subpalustris]